MKRWIPTVVVAVAALAMLARGPIPQLANYHDFADKRFWCGVANAGDVLSNLGFALVAAWGVVALWPRRAALGPSWPGYALFLFGVGLTALGSGYYHLAPDNDRLVWDRLPIALACAGLLLAVRGETRGHQPIELLGLAIVAAVGSVGWWWLTESRGGGDLRPYLLLQAAPLVVIPLWQWIYEAPRADRIAFGIAIACYAAAKGFELADRRVFEALGLISGHTIKHLLAVVAAAVLVGNAIRRSTAAPTGESSAVGDGSRLPTAP